MLRTDKVCGNWHQINWNSLQRFLLTSFKSLKWMKNTQYYRPGPESIDGKLIVQLPTQEIDLVTACLEHGSVLTLHFT